MLRSNRNELKKEIQRVKDTLQTQKPGTAEYGMTSAQYQHLLELERDLKKIDVDVLKVVLSTAGGIGGLFLYRKMFDSSADPLFRDLGKQILSVIKHS